MNLSFLQNQKQSETNCADPKSYKSAFSDKANKKRYKGSADKGGSIWLNKIEQDNKTKP